MVESLAPGSAAAGPVGLAERPMKPRSASRPSWSRWVALCLAVAFCGLAPGRAWARGLVLATTVFFDEHAAQEHFGRLARYLERGGLGPVQVVLAADYASASDELRRGDVDLAYLSPLLACRSLRAAPDLRYVASSRLSAASSDYRAQILSLAAGPVVDLAAAAGTSLGLVSEDSAAGYLFPLARLLALGVDPARHFRKIYLLGTHQAALQALRDGSVAVAAAYAPSGAAGAETDDLRVLAVTEAIPAASLLASAYLSPEVVRRVRAALLDPAYAAAVLTPGAPRAYSDHGWALLEESLIDAPCRTQETLRAARRAADCASEAP